jgi:hypothetical protein
MRKYPRFEEVTRPVDAVADREPEYITIRIEFFRIAIPTNAIESSAQNILPTQQ